MARVKFDVNKAPHERIPKRTSISKRKKPKFSSMNKHKKSQNKSEKLQRKQTRYKGGGR